MKLTFMRTSTLLALAIGLTACGGKATFELSGPITGQVYDGLVITNVINGDSVTLKAPTPVDAAHSFRLSKTLEYGQAYDVQIKGIPPHQDCALSGGADTAGRLSTISIRVGCALQQFVIGGTVTGMPAVAGTTPSGLKVTNGTDTRAIEVSGHYDMPLRVPFGTDYGVAIVSQPTGKVCTISNPSGTVKTVKVPPVAPSTVETYTDAVDNINITCV
jgi:hypothetical protein